MGQAQPSEKIKIASRVLLVDDHPILRQGLTQLINQETGLRVCGEAEDAQEALKLLPALKPEILVLDLSLKGMNGLEFLKILKLRYPKLPVLVLSMHEEFLYAERSIRAGARGYIMKQEGTEKLVTAIRKVLGGEIYVSEALTNQMLIRLAENPVDSAKSPVEQLSDRELEVFQMIGEGLGTRQIAEKLCLSIKTVESYREHIKQKLNLKNSIELIHHAIDIFRSKKSE